MPLTAFMKKHCKSGGLRKNCHGHCIRHGSGAMQMSVREGRRMSMFWQIVLGTITGHIIVDVVIWFLERREE